MLRLKMIIPNAFRLSLLITVLTVLLIENKESLLQWINQSFLWGLGFLLFGAILTVLKSGSLDLFLVGFKKLKYLIFRKPRVFEEEWDRLDQDLTFTEQMGAWRNTATNFSLSAGTALLFFSASLLIYYYI